MSRMNSPKDFWRVNRERKTTTKQAWKIYKHCYFRKRTDRFVCAISALSPVDHKGLY